MSVSNAFEIEEKVVRVHGKLRENMGVKSVSDVVTSLLKERRRKLLNAVFGIDAKRVKSFMKMTEVRIVADTYAWIEGIPKIEAEIFIFNSFIV